MSPDKRKARIAFIGCGNNARANLYPALAQLDEEVELVAVCDAQPELSERVARTYGAGRAYTDMDAMLDNEDVDGVAVIGPPQMHVEVGSRVLERGLPLLVEKPSAINASEARKLAQLADEQNTFGMVAFMKRFSIGYRMAKHLAQQEQFGGAQMIEAKFSQGPYPPIWGIESPALSFLTGQVVHLFDLVRFFGGDVKTVHASYREATTEQFGFFITVQFRSGAIGLLNLNTLEARESWRDFEERLVIAGVENQVTVDDMIYLKHQAKEDWIKVPGLDVGRLHKTWRPSGPAARKTEELIGYKGELAHFAACARDRTPAIPSLWDGVAALQLTEAVWQSAQSGEIVSL